MKNLYRFFFLLLIVGCGVSKNKTVYLEDVQDGKQLNLAKSRNIDWFFFHRMENAEGKKKWHIVNNAQHDSAVYYGQIKKIENGEYVVEPFYYIDKPTLVKMFPSYMQHDGSVIKKRIYQEHIIPLIKENIIKNCEKRYRVEFYKKVYKLTDKGIEVKVLINGYCYDKKTTKLNLYLLLDKNDLSVLEKKILQ